MRPRRQRPFWDVGTHSSPFSLLSNRQPRSWAASCVFSNSRWRTTSLTACSRGSWPLSDPLLPGAAVSPGSALHMRPQCPRLNRLPCHRRQGACLAGFHQKRVQLERRLTSGWNSYCVWKRLGQSQPKFALQRAALRRLRVARAGGARGDPPSPPLLARPGGLWRCLPLTRRAPFLQEQTHSPPRACKKPSPRSCRPRRARGSRGEWSWGGGEGGRGGPPDAPGARMPALSSATQCLRPIWRGRPL